MENINSNYRFGEILVNKRDIYFFNSNFIFAIFFNGHRFELFGCDQRLACWLLMTIVVYSTKVK